MHYKLSFRGYRNPELESKQRKRILFLGDSITCADYVDEEETFVRIVQNISETNSELLETVNGPYSIPRLGKQVFKTIELCRNVIMHSGELSNEDIERIGTAMQDWIKQVGA